MRLLFGTLRVGALVGLIPPECFLVDLFTAVEQRSLQARQAEIATRLALLTPREHEVMEMVADGRSNKEIANALGVSAKTVEAHRARVMEKTGARSLAELVRMVLTANLVDEDQG